MVAIAALALFALALWPRLSLPPRMVTADEDTWVGLTGNFAAALADRKLERTYQIGHPGTTAMWASLAGMGFERARRYAGLVAYADRVSTRRAAARVQTFVDDLAAARRGHAVANAALVAVLGLLGWRLLGPAAGLLTGALLALDPFLVAHAQVIRMDSLQAGFLGVGLLACLVRWLRAGGRAYLVLGGAALGLALLSKTSSVVVGLPLFMVAAWSLVRHARAGTFREGLTRLGTDCLLLGFVTLALFFLGLPAMWVAPTTAVGGMIDYTLWNGGQPPDSGNFFLGRAVPDPGPLFYPVALLYRLTPLTILGLGALGFFMLRRSDSRAARSVLIWLLVVVAIFLLALTPAPKKADRYLLPIWPMLVLLSAAGLTLLVRAAGQRRNLAAALVALLLVGQLVWLPPFSTYALAYYNPLLGGPNGAKQAMMVGWGEGLETAAAYLNTLPQPGEVVATTLYSEPLRANLRGRSLPLSRFAEADYLVQYVNMDQRDLLPTALAAVVADSHPVSTVEIAGLEVASVYALPRPEFGGALRIDQYVLEDDSAARGDRLDVTLRWTALTPAASSWRPRAEFIDRAGRIIATAEVTAGTAPLTERNTAVVMLKLPDSRANLNLVLSVMDEGGRLVGPTSVPPWAQAQGARVFFAPITVRVR